MFDMGITLTGIVTLSKRFRPPQVTGLVAWYDPSDLGTLFQDVAMTVPVTADGQSVAAMRDKSGAGHHLTQASAGLRPLYKTDGILHWLLFDGVDDVMTAGPVHGAARTISIAMRPVAGSGPIVYGAQSAANLRSYVGINPTGSAFSAGVGSAASADLNIGGDTTDTDIVGWMTHDGTNVLLGRDGETEQTFAQNGTTTPGAAAWLGAFNDKGSAAFNMAGRVYGLVDHDRALTAPERLEAATFLASKSGVTL